MSTVTRMRVRHSAPDTDAAKLDALEAVGREFGRLVRWQVHRLRPASRLADAHDPRRTVKAFRASPKREQFSTINSHLQQEAISRACAIVKGGWAQAGQKVNARIARRVASGKLSEGEAHELNWLLCWPAHLATVISGGTLVPAGKDGAVPEDMAGNDHAALDRWLAAALLRARPEQPHLDRAPWLLADATTYSASEPKGLEDRVQCGKVATGRRTRTPRRATSRTAWITLPTLVRGKPVRIPLAGEGTGHLAEGKTLRVAVVRDRRGQRRIELRYAIEIEVRERTGGVLAGADKGITTVLTVTEGDDTAATFHGTDYGPALTAMADGLKTPGRSRVWSEQKTALAEAEDPAAGRDPQKAATKARHIQRHNLGTRKKTRRYRRAHARLRQIGNEAIKDALATHPDVTDLAIEDLGFATTADRGPRVNRRLGLWAKGQLRRDIARISEGNGVVLHVVNAAYSSQACPRCFQTSRKNRQGQAFRCSRCGYRGTADAVAASNLRSRVNDPEIARYTPYRVVKQVLKRRAAERAEALGLRPTGNEDHRAAPGMTTDRNGDECPPPASA